MAELYDPFSIEFINWLFQHLQNCYKETCSKQFINTVLEPECIKRLYSQMFQTSGAHTDELLYESAVLASEIDQGLSFEDTLKALRKRLCSGSESDIEHLEANEKKIALGRHSEKNKGLFGNFSQFGGGGLPIPKTFVN